MSDKRSTSFKRILPNLFFPSKAKHKSNTESIIKQHKRSDFFENADREVDRIYENLDNYHEKSKINDPKVEEKSITSSSSTLVSEQPLKIESEKKLEETKTGYVPMSKLDKKASPQLHTKRDAGDVYYHDMNKDSIVLPMADDDKGVSLEAPQYVRADIKCSSTQFTISPKKESAVRLNKQMRAKSLSPDKFEPVSETLKSSKNNEPEKPYSYSGPTNLSLRANKIPNMPEVHKAVSPYDHVRKSINQAEESSRYGLVSNISEKNSSTKSLSPTTPPLKPPATPQEISKETTRKNLEAFYWQQLKQMKITEEENLLRKVPTTPQIHKSIDSFTRSNSLPRKCVHPSLEPKPFVRGGFARSTIDASGASISWNVKHSSRASEAGSNSENAIHTGAATKLQSSLKPETKQLHHEHRILVPKSNNKNVPKEISRKESTESEIVLRHPEKDKRMLEKICKEEKAAKHTIVQRYDRKMVMSLQDWKPIIVDAEVPRPPPRTTSWTSVSPTAKLLHGKRTSTVSTRSIQSGSESGSECAEIQRIIDSSSRDDSRIDDYQSALSDVECGRAPSRSRPSRRDDPRRHTLAGNHHYMHAYHPQPLRALDLEQMQRGYMQHSMFDDDPGIMSEVETSSTGFRRGGKQRSSLPVVRTPSKTLERPLGLVFLQFRNETKRALLPNEITSIDTVKALFVRSFPQQLNMHYMDSPLVKIYIHDSSKDMFYELEDKRAHLRDIGDRSVLRLFESVEMGGGGFPGALNVGTGAMPPGAAPCGAPKSWDQDQNYFSEPEMDSEYHHQHIHKSKQKVAPAAYYMGAPASTLPRGGSLLRTYPPAAPPVPADRVKSLPTGAALGGPDGYAPSPERMNMRYEDAYYPAYAPQAGRNPPPIDEETSEPSLDEYQLYSGAPPSAPNRPGVRTNYNRMAPGMEMARMRDGERWYGVEQQLANLTGLVTALVDEHPQHPAHPAHMLPGPHKHGGLACGPACGAGPPPAPRLNLDYPYRGQDGDLGDDVYASSAKRAPKLGKDRYQKSVSFEKSVSFSDDPPGMNSPKQHSPIHSDSKPPKPAIKSSTLPRTSSQERDRLKPAPPPKPVGLVAPPPPGAAPPQPIYVNITAEFTASMRDASRDAADIQLQLRNLRRTVVMQATTMRKMISDTTAEIHSITQANSRTSDGVYYMEECYRQQMLALENDLYGLEAMVERLRGQAATNKDTRVNMADVEHIAMILSRSSRTVADWKINLPLLCEKLKRKINYEMEKLVRKEKLLEEEPERLEIALRRCKKLTGTLVTLKRLACVQEQRLPDYEPSSGYDDSAAECDTVSHHVPTPHSKVIDGGNGAHGRAEPPRPENALDALLDELQTFAKPPSRDGPLRRLASYPSGSDTDASPPVQPRNQTPAKPPVPERHPELLAMATRRAPPPPPPRTTSRSPLASPTSPDSPGSPVRQQMLEQRHQELLKKQKALQEQYARLQMIQRSSNSLPLNAPDLKKTGSESNLLGKMNLNMSVSGSLTHLASAVSGPLALPKSAESANDATPLADGKKNNDTTSTKVYETDIL